MDLEKNARIYAGIPEDSPQDLKYCVMDKKAKHDAFIAGYQQAEKDLALTWEDMNELYIIFADVDTDIELCMTDIKSETIGYYEEVLKRFKAKKRK